MIIEFAGIDGAGKSTQMDRVFRYLNERGIPCYQRSLRSTFKRVLADVAESAGHRHWSDVFSANEAEVAHALEMVTSVYRELLPISRGKQVILTDTYRLRWLATAGLWGADMGKLDAIFSSIPAADLELFLDVAPVDALQRVATRPKGDHALSLGNQGKMERYARSFANVLKDRPAIVRVETTSESRTFDLIIDHVCKTIGLRPSAGEPSTR